MLSSNEHKNDEFQARRDVAKGAGTVALAKTGSVIEIITQPAYTWMFGLATYGLYAVLWSFVNLLQNIADLAMTNALQRVLPKTNNMEERAAIIKGSFILGILPSFVIALCLFLITPTVASWFNVSDKDLQQLEIAIALFIWALPLWSIVEVTTSALRACQAFGPEIRLRLVWEQILRFVLATTLWLAGVDTLALLIAHLGSLFITAILALRLLNTYCSLKLVWRAKLPFSVLRELLLSGLSVLPSNTLTRMFADMPVILINFMLPGANGATAAGLYSIARKLSSIPQLIRSVFSHVVAPVAASRANEDHLARQTLYAFSIRLSMLLALPTALTLIVAADSILTLFATGAAAAWPILIILTAARGIEAGFGPATAVQQVLSHRGLPVLNSVLGFSVTLAILFFTFPLYQAVGVALSVAAGQVIIAILAVLQLSRVENLHIFDGNFSRILVASLAACTIIFAVMTSLSFTPNYVQNIMSLLVYLLVVWLSLRFALVKNDRIALGKFGRRLRLVP